MSNPPTSSGVVNPLCIILVKNGSKGDRLLFRYPYKTYSRHSSEEVDDFRPSKSSHLYPAHRNIRANSVSQCNHASNAGFSHHNPVFHNSDDHGAGLRTRKTSRNSPPSSRRSNPYAVVKNNTCDDIFSNCRANDRILARDVVLGELSDRDLANLLAVNSDLSEKKFELKINEVRFVGHPTLMHSPRDKRPLNPAYQTSVKLFNIVFCLNARASHSIVKCFYDLSKRLGIGLRHEEYRCGYVSQEMKHIISKLDEACVDHADEDSLNAREMLFNDILAMSNLAKLMKRVYDDVCDTGFVKIKINNWVQVSFCLPQKIHTLPFRKTAPLVEPEKIHKCLEAIRPYHAILLLVEREALVASFWVDASSTIPRLLQVYSPLKSLQTLAADADLTLSQVVEIASHLVYWAAAIVIYPMCESNVYVIAPDAPITSPELASAFTESFPGVSLSQLLSDFSMPMPLGERINPLLGVTSSQMQLVQLVCWLLKHRLLIQLHTYLYMSTYLDGYQEATITGRLSEVDDDGSLKMSLQPYEDDDDATVSDYSETTADDFRHLVSPLPTVSIPEQEIINLVNHDESHDQEKFKGSLSEMQDTVKRAVAHIKIPLSIQDIKMFNRLSKYFTGEFHLEEIMYRENVRRSQLMLLLDKFRDVLITVEKDDSDINFFRLEG
ncbi:unnamed protein product [Allacma fusca]|uniref:GATOR complex protein NPRL3 n=1 Tax=Allacma fusca TaxID=39272 RepID=A0A8J2LN78_9HEXA|nr:unnamed protein product [Allacma fusca]